MHANEAPLFAHAPGEETRGHEVIAIATEVPGMRERRGRGSQDSEQYD